MLDNLSPLAESIALDLGKHAGKRTAIQNLSGAAFIGEHLYLANDEGRHLLRLTRDAPRRYGTCTAIGIADLFKLQDGEVDRKEFDLEALAVDTRDGRTVRLWLIGSHAMGHDEPPGSDLRRLGLRRQRNRLLFGCIEVDEQGAHVEGSGRHLRISPIGGTWTTRFLSALREAPPSAGGFVREASALAHLTIPEKVAGSIGWFTPYTMASTKENGLDVEGLVVRRRGEDASKVVALVGLRGPVIDGFAVVIEVEIRDHNRRRLKLEGAPRFHLLNLQGFGVRDLEWRGDDLLILAGPTMTRQTESELFCWRNAWNAMGARGPVANVLEVDTIDRLGPLPMKDDGGPEAIATITPGSDGYMLLRDGIKGERLDGSTYHAEVYRIAEP
ncbi:MAG: DUF3616 domain-containing protein [Alphaproteobacteria bacterium]|nr:DUF3616 domain-containing protein [Alphaproteobacteria bacterium]MCW5738840.1 DUF3616 domain-containing protein [Alphaproteobacteria bacterium]